MARSRKWFKPPRSSRVARSYIQLLCLIIGGYDVRKMPHEPNYSILMHTIDLSHIALISNHAPASDDHPTTSNNPNHWAIPCQLVPPDVEGWHGHHEAVVWFAGDPESRIILPELENTNMFETFCERFWNQPVFSSNVAKKEKTRAPRPTKYWWWMRHDEVISGNFDFHLMWP